MRDELELKLAEKFPFMQQKPTLEEQKQNGHITNLYTAFGCEFGDGWFQLMCDMCQEITNAYENAGVEIDIIPAQAKEKFGTLRFYYDIKGQEQAIHAFDFLGQGSLRFTDKSTPLYKEISNIVRKYETKSATICEKCGKAGKLRKDLSWVLTLCDECYEKRKERKSLR